MTLKFGKYAGATMEDVYSRDPNYVFWMWSNATFSSKNREVAAAAKQVWAAHAEERKAAKAAMQERVMIAVGFRKIGDEINGHPITSFGQSWRMDSDDDRVYQVLGRPEAGTGPFSVCYAYFS